MYIVSIDPIYSESNFNIISFHICDANRLIFLYRMGVKGILCKSCRFENKDLHLSSSNLKTCHLSSSLALNFGNNNDVKTISVSFIVLKTKPVSL